MMSTTSDIKLPEAASIRIARPSRNLTATESFYVDGLGLDVLFRLNPSGSDQAHLLMLGYPGSQWHLELTRHHSSPIPPAATVEDLLVLYLGMPAGEEQIAKLLRHGGRVVRAHNPYWDKHGTTIEDPDGYRLVLCSRTWDNASAAEQMDTLPDTR